MTFLCTVQVCVELNKIRRPRILRTKNIKYGIQVLVTLKFHRIEIRHQERETPIIIFCILKVSYVVTICLTVRPVKS